MPFIATRFTLPFLVEVTPVVPNDTEKIRWTPAQEQEKGGGGVPPPQLNCLFNSWERRRERDTSWRGVLLQ